MRNAGLAAGWIERLSSGLLDGAKRHGLAGGRRAPGRLLRGGLGAAVHGANVHRLRRLHGRGRVVTPGSAQWPALGLHFPADPAQRAIIVVEVTRVSDSCGYGVPKLAFASERDAMQRWAETKGIERLPEYRRQKNAQSIDGLPALDPDEASGL